MQKRPSKAKARKGRGMSVAELRHEDFAPLTSAQLGESLRKAVKPNPNRARKTSG